METFNEQDARDLWWITLVKASSFENRPHVITVLIKDQWAVKTDGARIHAHLLENPVADGLYHVIKRTKREMRLIIDEQFTVKDFPDWIGTIFPRHDEKNHEAIHLQLVDEAIYELARNGAMVNCKFIQDLFKDDWHYDWIKYNHVDYSTNEGSNGLIFHAPPDRLAVIMPIRKWL